MYQKSPLSWTDVYVLYVWTRVTLQLLLPMMKRSAALLTTFSVDVLSIGTKSTSELSNWGAGMLNPNKTKIKIWNQVPVPYFLCGNWKIRTIMGIIKIIKQCCIPKFFPSKCSIFYFATHCLFFSLRIAMFHIRVLFEQFLWKERKNNKFAEL